MMNALHDEMRLTKLEHVVNGNGRPGLKSDVAVLQKEVGELGNIKARVTRCEIAIWTAAGALGALELYLKFHH
jgi:hypothetical protein